MNINKLNLTKNNELPIEFIKLMNQTEENIRIKYNLYIDDLLKLNLTYKFAFLQRSSVRNTYKSKLFKYLCLIETISIILQNGSIKEITTDSKSLRNCLLQLPAVKNNLCKIKYLNNRNFIFSKVLKNILGSLYLIILRYLISRVFFKKKKNLNDITLIDTFITSKNFNENNNFNEIYYKNLFHYSLDFKKKIYFFPTFYKINSPLKIFKAFQSLKKSDYQFIIIERYFNLFNLLKAFYYSIIIPFNLKKIPKWNNIDISSIINHEKYLDIGEHSLLQSIIIYKSIEYIKKNNINLRIVIDWFENQNIDRALNHSVRKNYPNAITKGYLGFVPEDYYAGLFPSINEYNFQMIPKKIITIGEVFEKKILKYCPKIQVTNGPAFRFQDIFKENLNSNNNNNNKNILLCLPMHLKESEEIIQLAINSKLNNNYKFIIKPHPLLGKNIIEKKISISRNSKFTFSENSLYNLFRESNMIITSASSTCLEAILFGLKVVIAGSKNELTKNNLAQIIDKKNWKICYDSKDFDDFYKQKNFNENYNIEDFFTPVNENTVKTFLDN